MTRLEIIDRLQRLAKHAVHIAGEPPEPPFIMSLDDGIALHEAIDILKAHEPFPPKIYGHMITSVFSNGESEKYPFYSYACRMCRSPIKKGMNFCPNCGKAIDWGNG